MTHCDSRPPVSVGSKFSGSTNHKSKLFLKVENNSKLLKIIQIKIIQHNYLLCTFILLGILNNLERNESTQEARCRLHANVTPFIGSLKYKESGDLIIIISAGESVQMPTNSEKELLKFCLLYLLSFLKSFFTF